MPAEDNTLEYRIDHGVAYIWLARPERRNALDDQLIVQLHDLLGRLDVDAAVRVIVLGGRGKAFCAGADLNWMQRSVDFDRSQNLSDAGLLARLLRRLDALATPTIARVHGACYAGATGLVATCDLAIASNDTNFCFSEVTIGLVPATISPYIVRAMGYRRALQHMLSADVFDAVTARADGLITEVVSADQLDERIGQLAADLIRSGPAALSKTRRLIREVADTPINDGLIQSTVECIADIRVSSEGQEGLRSLLAQRAPDWRRP